MKILFTSKGTDWDSSIDPRFGRAEFFFMYDEETDEITTFDNREINDVAHGAGPRTAKKMTEFSIDIVVTGNGPGKNAASVIEQLGVKIYSGAGSMTNREAYNAFKKNELNIS